MSLINLYTLYLFHIGGIFFKDLFYLWVHCCCLQTHQKRASDPIRDGCEPPCSCWELNSGPLEEQSVLLTAEPLLQTPSMLLLIEILIFFDPFISMLQVWVECFTKSYVYHTCAWCLRASHPLETGLRDGWKPPCGCQEPNWGSLQKQGLLITEPSLGSNSG